MLEPNAVWSEVVDADEVSRDGGEAASVGGEVSRDGSEVSRDGSEASRDSGEVSDVELSSCESSSESSDDSEGLVTVSERRSASDRDVPRISTSYSSAIKKNLPADVPEKVSYRPNYLSEFEKEHFNRENVMPDRPYTAFFNAPSSSFTAKDIFDALLTDGIPASAVRCLQRSPNGNVLITFASQKYRDLFLRRSSFIVRRSHFVTHPGSRRLLFVTVYDAPHELPDSALEHRLGRYGRIFSTRRGMVQGYPDVFNGLRHLRMELKSHIPCFLRFGKYQVRVKYDGQPTTCRRCNSRDHLYKDCNNSICFNCDKVGHHSRLCPEDIKCCICKEEGHMAIDCLHSWYRRPPPSGTLSSSNPDDSVPPLVERPAQPAETQDASVPQADLADPASQPGSSDVQVLDLQGTLISTDSAAAELSAVPSPSVSVSLFSGDQPSPTPASAVPSVSDSVLGQIPSVPEDPVPSVTDSALAVVVIPPASPDPVPSVTDSALAEMDIPPASLDPVPSVSDSVLAQVDVPSPSDVPALDLTQPDENDDDDEMGDSVASLETEKLATAWKRVSRKKGQRRKNLARKAATSHSFAPVRKATRPNPPGVRPNRGKDPPE